MFTRSPGPQSPPPRPLCRCPRGRTQWRQDEAQNQNLHVFIVLVFIMLVFIVLVFIMLVFIVLVFIMLVFIVLVFIVFLFIMLVFTMPLRWSVVTCHIDSEVVPDLPSAVHHNQGVETGRGFVNLGEGGRKMASLIRRFKNQSHCKVSASM